MSSGVITAEQPQKAEVRPEIKMTIQKANFSSTSAPSDNCNAINSSVKKQIDQQSHQPAQIMQQNMKTAMDTQLEETLQNFGQLVSKYQYGEPLVEASGGFHLDKGLQQPRCSLLPALHAGATHAIPFGPPTNSKAVVQVPSEGEESEIDITDLLSMSGVVAHNSQTQQQPPANTKGWYVQEAWTQQSTQQSSSAGGGGGLLSQAEKLHPHSQKLFQGKIVQEEKGGPRIRDILEQMIDLKSLRPIGALRRLPKEHVYSGQLAIYLTLQGLDPHQKATQIARRLKTWLALYDTNRHQKPSNSQNQAIGNQGGLTQPQVLDTRPSFIHVYPNQVHLSNLASDKSSPPSSSHSRRDSSPPDSNEMKSNQYRKHGLQNSATLQGSTSNGVTAYSSSKSSSTLCLVQFQDPKALEHVYKVLKAQSDGLLNEAKQPIRFGMAYDSRCLGESGWVGVILRNLPHNATSSGILNNFTKLAQSWVDSEYKPENMVDSVPYHITNIADPVRIKDQFCTVLTVPDIEEAERICFKWDSIEVNEKHQKLKAHLHPYSYRKRPTDKLSIHPIFKPRYDPVAAADAKREKEKQKRLSSVQQTATTPESLPQNGALIDPQNSSDQAQKPEKRGLASLMTTEDKQEVTTAIKEDPAAQSIKNEGVGEQRSRLDALLKQSPQSSSAQQAPNAPNQELVQVKPAPKQSGLLALLDQEDLELARKKNEKPVQAPSALAIMDEMMLDDQRDKKNKKRKMQLQEQRKKEQEKQIQALKQQLAGKKRSREDVVPQKKSLMQSSIQGSLTKRVKREDAPTSQQATKSNTITYSDRDDLTDDAPQVEQDSSSKSPFANFDDPLTMNVTRQKKRGRKEKFAINRLARCSKKIAKDHQRKLKVSPSNEGKSNVNNGAIMQSDDHDDSSCDEKTPIATIEHDKKMSDQQLPQPVKESIEFSNDELGEQSGLPDGEQNQMSSPTEDTENVCHNAFGFEKKNVLKTQMRSDTVAVSESVGGFIDFTSGRQVAPLTRLQSTSSANMHLSKQLGRAIDANQPDSSREITPVTVRPHIVLTAKEKSKLLQIEENLQKRIESGNTLETSLLKLVAQHLSISHPEAMIKELGKDAGVEEPKKRGRKSNKQRMQEMVRSSLQTPLQNIQCSVSFSVPGEFAEALSAEQATSSRQSSVSKPGKDGGSRDFDSMIFECKTRNMRRKVQELSTAAASAKQVQNLKANDKPQSAEATIMSTTKIDGAGIATNAQAPSSGTCLLNLKFDLAVDKLLKMVSDESAAEHGQAESSTVPGKRGLGRRATTASHPSKIIDNTGLTSNVHITAEK